MGGEQADYLREHDLLPLRRTEGFRHEARSGIWVLDHLMDEPQCWGKEAARVAASALRGHHGNFHPACCGDDTCAYEKWERMRGQLTNLVSGVLGVCAELFSPNKFVDASSTGVKLTDLIVLSDWISSNNELFRYPSLDTGADPGEYW